MIKFLVMGIILYVTYFVFFRKPKEIKNNKEHSEPIESLIECQECGTFVPKEDTILSNGKYYCSNECVNKAYSTEDTTK
jgi:uncharacterized protein